MPLSNVTNDDILAYYKVVWEGRRNLRVPNLLGVGAGRAGTTLIYRLLRASSDVYVPPVKEVNYFGVFDSRVLQGGFTDRDYCRMFLLASSEKYVGEVSPVYLTRDASAQAIHEFNKDMRIIITLRDPVQRAISQYKHQKDQTQEKDIDEYFETGLLNIDNAQQRHWFTPANNLHQSLYAEPVERFLSLFGRENICFLIYEDLQNSPSDWLKKLEEFLTVPLDLSVASERYNYSSGAVDQVDKRTMDRLKKLFRADIEKTSELLGRNLMRVWPSFSN